MSSSKFQLWLEFEHWEPNPEYDPFDDFFNMVIELPDGRRYALNVWTFRFLERCRYHESHSDETMQGRYPVAPDLFVERLDRELLQEVVADLIRTRQLKPEWLAPHGPEEVKLSTE